MEKKQSGHVVFGLPGSLAIQQIEQLIEMNHWKHFLVA